MKNLILFTTVLFSMIVISCKRDGCTDLYASNFDEKATDDDGSCIYEGCTDTDALNYSPSADIDDGSCTYPSDVFIYNLTEVPSGKVIEVFWDEDYVGAFAFASQEGIDYCVQTDEAIDILDLEPGTYSYEAFLKTGGTNEQGQRIKSGSIQLGANICEYVLID
ncbi:MAG: hypothetical protein WEC59_09595 [Salibacteraceae bacterium]